MATKQITIGEGSDETTIKVGVDNDGNPLTVKVSDGGKEIEVYADENGNPLEDGFDGYFEVPKENLKAIDQQAFKEGLMNSPLLGGSPASSPASSPPGSARETQPTPPPAELAADTKQFIIDLLKDFGIKGKFSNNNELTLTHSSLDSIPVNKVLANFGIKKQVDVNEIEKLKNDPALMAALKLSMADPKAAVQAMEIGPAAKEATPKVSSPPPAAPPPSPATSDRTPSPASGTNTPKKADPSSQTPNLFKALAEGLVNQRNAIAGDDEQEEEDWDDDEDLDNNAENKTTPSKASDPIPDAKYDPKAKEKIEGAEGFNENKAAFANLFKPRTAAPSTQSAQSSAPSQSTSGEPVAQSNPPPPPAGGPPPPRATGPNVGAPSGPPAAGPPPPPPPSGGPPPLPGSAAAPSGPPQPPPLPGTPKPAASAAAPSGPPQPPPLPGTPKPAASAAAPSAQPQAPQQPAGSVPPPPAGGPPPPPPGTQSSAPPPPPIAADARDATDGLTDAQIARLEEFKKGLKTHLDKQNAAEEKADAAAPKDFKDAWVDNMKDMWKQTKSAFTNATPPKDEYEAFAQLFLLIMQMFALTTSPASAAIKSALDKAWSGIKQDFYDHQAKKQGENYNNVEKQEQRLEDLNQQIAASQEKINSGKLSDHQLKFENAKLAVLMEAKEKTEEHLNALKQLGQDNTVNLADAPPDSPDNDPDDIVILEPGAEAPQADSDNDDIVILEPKAETSLAASAMNDLVALDKWLQNCDLAEVKTRVEQLIRRIANELQTDNVSYDGTPGSAVIMDARQVLENAFKGKNLDTQQDYIKLQIRHLFEDKVTRNNPNIKEGAIRDTVKKAILNLGTSDPTPSPASIRIANASSAAQSAAPAVSQPTVGPLPPPRDPPPPLPSLGGLPPQPAPPNLQGSPPVQLPPLGAPIPPPMAPQNPSPAGQLSAPLPPPIPPLQPFAYPTDKAKLEEVALKVALSEKNGTKLPSGWPKNLRELGEAIQKKGGVPGVNDYGVILEAAGRRASAPAPLPPPPSVNPQPYAGSPQLPPVGGPIPPPMQNPSPASPAGQIPAPPPPPFKFPGNKDELVKVAQAIVSAAKNNQSLPTGWPANMKAFDDMVKDKKGVPGVSMADFYDIIEAAQRRPAAPNPVATQPPPPPGSLPPAPTQGGPLGAGPVRPGTPPPQGTSPNAIKPFEVPFEGRTAQAQADQIIARLKEEIAAGKKVAITYSANNDQAEAIYKGYKGAPYAIGGGGQAQVMAIVAQRIQNDPELKGKARILPVATCLHAIKGDGTDKPVSKKEVDRDLNNIAEHLGEGWSVLGLRNEKTQTNRYAIGGGFAGPLWNQHKSYFDERMAQMTRGEFTPELQQAYNNGATKRPNPSPLPPPPMPGLPGAGPIPAVTLPPLPMPGLPGAGPVPAGTPPPPPMQGTPGPANTPLPPPLARDPAPSAPPEPRDVAADALQPVGRPITHVRDHPPQVPIAQDTGQTINDLHAKLDKNEGGIKEKAGVAGFTKVEAAAGQPAHINIKMYTTQDRDPNKTTDVKAETKPGAPGVTYTMKNNLTDDAQKAQTIQQICDLAVMTAKPGTVLRIPTGNAEKKEKIEAALKQSFEKAGIPLAENAFKDGAVTVPTKQPPAAPRPGGRDGG